MEKDIKGSSETTREITIQGRHREKINFYNWWIGFLEGDGSFFIRSNNTLGFEISQKTTDAQVLYYIKTNLGFGQVNHNSKVGLSRFIISSKKESYLNLINLLKIDNLRLIKRQEQYKLWIQKAESITNMSLLSTDVAPTGQEMGRGSQLGKQGVIDPSQPSWEDSWLSGFIDAEGCFRIGYDKEVGKYRLIFQITQDEIEILEKIKLLLGKNHRGNIIKDRGTYLFMMSGKNAREQLINYLNVFPLKTQKRIAFMKWKKCHKLLLRMEEETGEQKEKTREEIKRLKEKINFSGSKVDKDS